MTYPSLAVAYDVADDHRRAALRQFIIEQYQGVRLSDSVYTIRTTQAAYLVKSVLDPFLRVGDALHVIPVGGPIASTAPSELVTLLTRAKHGELPFYRN